MSGNEQKHFYHKSLIFLKTIRGLLIKLVGICDTKNLYLDKK